ncbi:NAD(P)/FAD-dependent oxidoreductase [Halobacillus kuroshimensis]|uniref:NAD(P)/FAD-dependent oxidoreductase n=1 Tax=Halobacillus kuroshimensis TaxID=302481 RepID=A0ABS3DX36_9BACI|nr:NAD(P)/FAD-dependent oxidoreductase [Halobacillus kuroshimensis]MBN8235794.1 NAD(P)/FAD-dependent oxidoreductase [Halobacillus kuroshimensis]
MSEYFEVIIVGGGPAGLSTALIMGRSKRKVLVLDANDARNRVTHASHGYLSRDGVKPEEFKAVGLSEITAYPTVSYMETKVTSLHKEGSRFHVQTETGDSFVSGRVVVAAGMKEELPEIKGLQDVYGSSVFPCPYCDGWEWRDEPLAIFGSEPWLIQYVKLIYNWSRDLIVFTNGAVDLPAADRTDLREHGVAVVEEPIVELISEGGELQQVVTHSGAAYNRSGGFIMDTGESQAFPLPEDFKIPYTTLGGVETKEGGETSVKGLYVIGDAKNAFSGLLKAASEGYELAAVMNHEMALEDWQLTNHITKPGGQG